MKLGETRIGLANTARARIWFEKSIWLGTARRSSAELNGGRLSSVEHGEAGHKHLNYAKNNHIADDTHRFSNFDFSKIINLYNKNFPNYFWKILFSENFEIFLKLSIFHIFMKMCSKYKKWIFQKTFIFFTSFELLKFLTRLF